MEKNELIRLIPRCQTGDAQAQEALVLAVQNRVFYHCKKMLKSEDDALDATQEVLISMLTKLDTLKEPAAFWGWLSAMTANYCRNALSRGHREVQIPEDEEGNSQLDTLETLDEQTIPDKALDSDESRRMIVELIDHLPEAQRLCVLMYYYDEMGVKEIAAALNTSEGTIKSRLNYARKSIKEGVEHYAAQGIKLYGLAPLPFLAYILKQDALLGGLSAAQSSTCAQAALAGSSAALAGSAAGTAAAGSGTAGAAAGTAGAGTAGTAGAGAAGAGTAGTAGAAGSAAAAGSTGNALAAALLAHKGIAAAVAGVVLAGAVGGTALLSHPDDPPAEAPTPPPVVEVMEPTPDPEPVTDPEPEAVLEPEPDPNPEVVPEPEPEPAPDPGPVVEPEPAPEPQPEPPPVTEPDPEPVAEPEPARPAGIAIDTAAFVGVPSTRGVPHTVYNLSTGEEIPASEITWSTDSPGIIDLSSDGTYHHGTGVGHITASWNGYTSTCLVETRDFDDTLYLGMTGAVIKQGSSVRFSLNENTIAKLGAGAAVSWVVQNPSLIRIEVDSDGYGVTVYGENIGSTYITCTAAKADGTSLYNYASVVVI